MIHLIDLAKTVLPPAGCYNFITEYQDTSNGKVSGGKGYFGLEQGLLHIVFVMEHLTTFYN